MKKKILIAIVAETKTDAYIYQKICEKILADQNIEAFFPGDCTYSTDQDKEQNSGGVKLKHLKAIKDFYDKTPCKKLDLKIVCTDHDSGKAENVNTLRSEAEKIGMSVGWIFVEPEENIECWLLHDQSTVNTLFGKKDRIFSKDMFSKAKEMFNEYVGQARMEPIPARRKFAKLIKVDYIKAQDFVDFKSELIREAKRVIEPAPILKEKPKMAKKRKPILITSRQAKEIINLLNTINKKIIRLLKNVEGGEN
jgi:hypothetical protein